MSSSDNSTTPQTSATSAPTSSAAPTSTPAATTASTTTASATTLPATTSVTSIPPTTTTVAPTTSATSEQPTTVVSSVTSVLTQSATNPGSGPVVTTITSTQSVITFTPTASDVSTVSSTSASSSPSQSALSASGSGSGKSGLSSGATIAIAVIIPIAAVIGLVIFGLWFWRRRKAKKTAEELRKNEMAEYGYNPNNDPTLPVGAAYTDGGSEGNDDSGYRGWGATSTNRKTSTTLGSNSRTAGMAGAGAALSDHGSQGGYGAQPNPPVGNGSDGLSQDPLVHGYSDGTTAGAAAGGAAMGGPRNRNSQAGGGVRRGPSNASSAYSGHDARSEASSDVPDVPRPYYQEEVPYNVYNDVQPGHGPYGDGTYDGQTDQPVIRDVQARRNTRIERAPTFPQQGGIAQNF